VCDQKGFEHKESRHGSLPIHRFVYDSDFDDLSFEMQVPYCAPRKEVIEIHKE
jgi:hypothetical protein